MLKVKEELKPIQISPRKKMFLAGVPESEFLIYFWGNVTGLQIEGETLPFDLLLRLVAPHRKPCFDSLEFKQPNCMFQLSSLSAKTVLLSSLVEELHGKNAHFGVGMSAILSIWADRDKISLPRPCSRRMTANEESALHQLVKLESEKLGFLARVLPRR